MYLSARFHGKIVVSRGTRVRLGRGAQIELAPRGRLRLGNRHPNGTPLSLRIRRGGRLTVGGEVMISSGGRVLVGDNARLEIGDQTFLHYDNVITCWEHITIGTGCQISWGCNILDGNGHALTIGGKERPPARSTHIGNDCWIGTGSTLVAVAIGDSTLVGAGSVVAGKVPPKVLVKGNPARVAQEDVVFEPHRF